MNVAEIHQRAIKDYYNNPGATTDFLTPVMTARWINEALMEYWSMFMDNEFGYYFVREQVLNVTTATNIYSLPNGNPTSGSPLNIAYVTGMAIRLGSSAPGYSYLVLTPLFPSDKYNNSASSFFFLDNAVGASRLSWCAEAGFPDTQGYPTQSVRFVPFPPENNTIVYDAVRYPYNIAITNDTTNPAVVTTQIPDLPVNFHHGLVLRVLKNAYIRAKIDLTEINREIKNYDDMQMRTMLRGVQRQGSLRIKRLGTL